MILLILVASNAYFNYTHIQMRMYSCVVLASGIAVWLYMRMTVNHRGATAKRWLAVAAAIYALLMFHVLSTLFLVVALFGCHVAFVRKDRSWFAFPLAMVCALALASPYLADVIDFLSAGSTIDRVAQNTLSMRLILPVEFARAGLSVVLNSSFGAGQLALIALPLAAIALSLADSRSRQSQVRVHLIALLGLIALLSCASVGLVTTERMRYAAALLLPLLFVIAAGLSALARQRSWAIVLVALYVIAGISHHSIGNSDLYVTYGWRRAITQAPLHAISRLALLDASRPLVIGFQQTPHWINMGMPDYGYGRLQERYFTRHGIQTGSEYLRARKPRTLSARPRRRTSGPFISPQRYRLISMNLRAICASAVISFVRSSKPAKIQLSASTRADHYRLASRSSRAGESGAYGRGTSAAIQRRRLAVFSGYAHNAAARAQIIQVRQRLGQGEAPFVRRQALHVK